MDFKGQALAEKLIFRILVVFAVVSFVVGYLLKDFKLMAQINGVGIAVTALVVLPNWPWFNKHPLKWLPALNPPSAEKNK